jgi:hypothetical protein
MGMRACVSRLPPSPHYRRDAFAAGLARCGYEITDDYSHPSPGDVLVLWNRYFRDEVWARKYEDVGGKVLVTENAWLGPEAKPLHHFALCAGHHNGAGKWCVGETPRPLDECTLAPWRERGDSILVLPQRGMGEPGIRQERQWLPSVLGRLARITRRPIVVRHHPGPRPHPPIDFTGHWAAVTWASGAAIKAIIAGCPVFYEFKDWIGGPAASFGLDNLEDPYLGTRRPMLHRLSWAQWTADEIATGEPFKCLLTL